MGKLTWENIQQFKSQFVKSNGTGTEKLKIKHAVDIFNKMNV